MASPRASEFSAGMAVLGLLVQQPDTMSGLGRRLEEEHPNARWPRNIVHTSIPSLLDQGLVRKGQPGSTRAQDLYEAAPSGVSYFRQELHRSAATLPALRDALRARLSYVADERELWLVIEDIREQEKMCVAESEAATARYRKAHARGRLTAAGEDAWKGRVRAALMADEVRLWQERARALQRLRKDLEDPAGKRDTLDE